MSRRFDAVVVGGGTNGLVAAITLARAGRKVLLAEAGNELGGVLREYEFTPGFRAVPCVTDSGYLSPEIIRATGLSALAEEIPPNASVVVLGEGEPLQLHRDDARTAWGLKRISPKDAERWPAFSSQVHRFTQFLAQLYRAPPPRIDASSLGELCGLANLGLKFHRLGKTDMIEFMRALPNCAADWLDDWFESTRLKGLLAALAVSDVAQGPMSGGTAFTFLHRHVGASQGVFGERLRLRMGPAALIAALAERARAAGVVIETATAVERVVVRNDRIAGAVLASGEDVACSSVISSLNPTRSLFELLDPKYLEVEFIQAVRNIRYRGATTRILLALDALPEAPVSLSSGLLIAPSTRYVEQAYDAVKYGRCSDEPVIELRFPSVTQANLAPRGKHVAVLHVQYTPYALREGNWNQMRDRIADRAIEIVERHLPGLSSCIRERVVLTPPDLEARFGLREGAASQGEMMLDQILFMRPVVGWSHYAMPVPGFYLCGTGTHPGGGITGMSGWLAAKSARSAS
jgi:phytoene dehydrogenase-like protein